MLKRCVQALGLFSVVVFAVVACGVATGLYTPHVGDQGRIDDLAMKGVVEIVDLRYDQALGGYPVTLDARGISAKLTLTMNNQSYDIYQDGQLVYAHVYRGENQYATTVDLRAVTGDALRLLIAPQNQPEARPGLLSFSGRQRPRVFIGGKEQTERLLRTVAEIQSILLGVHGALLVMLLLLLFSKRTEGYLLDAAIVAAAQIVTTMSLMNSQLVHIPYSSYGSIISVQYIVPLSLMAYVLIRFFREDYSPFFRRLIGPVPFLAITAVAILLQEWLHVNIYNLLRRLFMLPVIAAFVSAFHHKRRGAAMMLMSYGFAEGIALYLYLLGTNPNLYYSVFDMYLRPYQFMYDPFLLCCILQAVGTFAHNFTRAEQSSEQEALLNQKLESIVQARTQELIQSQQARNNMMLQIFHDLRSPIFVIKASFDQLRVADKESAEILNTVKNRTLYLERLTENLFTSAKLGEKEIIYDQDYVRLDRLMRGIAASERLMAEEKGVVLAYDKELPIATWGDGVRIQQAIINVVDNAISNTGSGGKVQINMALEADMACIYVCDNGLGIPKAELDRIFDRFYRVVSGRHSNGLGLYIAQGIIRDHGGEIRVKSEQGVGSEFLIRLPLCPLEEEECADD